MKFDFDKRWFAWIALLALALGASVWVKDKEKSDRVAVVEPLARAGSAARTRGDPEFKVADRVQLDRLRERKPAAGEVENAFAARSWRKPAPPPAPPPAPTAPPLPFTYLGKIASTEANMVFVAQGDRNLIVRAGDTINATYRVERIAGNVLTFTHLPTGIQQTLAIGGSP